MRSRSQSIQTHVIKEEDILSAPMEKDHKLLALRHFRRLMKIIDEDDQNTVSRYTSRQAAREQLARMTLVFRDYIARYHRREIGDEVESMVADIVDASFFVAGKEHTYEQPTFANPLLMGREQEIVALMQELQAGNVDDVVELWNVHPTDKVLPDSRVVDDIGREIDWNRILCRSSSEDNLLYHRRENFVVKNRLKWQSSLSKRNIKCLDRSWPPNSPEAIGILTVRSRSGTDVSEGG